MNPVTLKKLKRFKSIKRGYYSFILFTLLVLVSLLAELLVNSRALVVSYQGTLYFPTYSAVIPGRHFGFDYDYETNYRQLKSRFAHEQKGDWVLLPPVPWNPYEQDFKEDAYPLTPPASPIATSSAQIPAGATCWRGWSMAFASPSVSPLSRWWPAMPSGSPSAA